MIGGVLGMGRRMAESRMTDECSISRDGDKVWDEDSGRWMSGLVSVYAGKCRIRHPATAAKEADAAGQLLVVSALEVHVPVGVLVEAGDIVHVTSSVIRPDQVGRRFKVISQFDGSQTTAVRLRVEAFDGR